MLICLSVDKEPKQDVHRKARGFIDPANPSTAAPYPGQDAPMRAAVPDDKVAWSVAWPEYAPVDYTAPAVAAGPVWADPADATTITGWNTVTADKIDRTSFLGEYRVVDGVPQNPSGRTGIKGRGLLGRWGPNHAADPIVTRWGKDDKGERQLEFVAIQRKDGGGWAIPGGMVESGDTVSATLKKEFGEEALNGLSLSEEETKQMEREIEELFGDKEGAEVFRGYCDEPRNTDNAWLETVAVHFHSESEDPASICYRIQLSAGDDAGAVRWLPVKTSETLYAGHHAYLRAACKRLGVDLPSQS
eukprot:TRINITY_DN1667_c0_g1_i5.p1 TRINITY_DN1667_c0_g1~~TRINITY_DN1667_c0_g1_i5.p1  ORF type:complete len:303 (-),score=52.27 TRINITY_DN1667_c0_g1_i5:348-1256(-)